MSMRFRPLLSRTQLATRHHRHAALGLLLGALVVSVALIGHLGFASLMMDRSNLSEVVQVLGHTRRDLVIAQVTGSAHTHERDQSLWPAPPLTLSSGKRFDLRFHREGDRLLAEAARHGGAYVLSLEADHGGADAAWAVNWRCRNHSDQSRPALLLSLCPPAERKHLP